MNNERACIGCLLGTAVGDALGLPYEGIAPRRAARMYPDPTCHHFVFGHGMVSDDTEHAVMTAQAVVRARGDVERFQRSLSRSLRWWFAALPAGVGLATARAMLKLWVGVPPSRSGVFSAGNGPAMRSPILGVMFGNDPEQLRAYVRKSTEITHRDPKAFHGALAVAVATRLSASDGTASPDAFIATLEKNLAGDNADELLESLHRAAASAAAGESTSHFATEMGLGRGITGYMLHTVPCVIQTWLRHPDDFATAVPEIIAAGGDTDTTAAILGAIIGARVGKEGIPENWINAICEWPRTTSWIEALGACLAAAEEGHGSSPPTYFVPGIPLRNAVFLALVLTHGFRRLAPPY